MTRAFWKNIFRTIFRSLGRYMAIFAIIALGVGFFSGIKASQPSMMKTAQDYIRETRLFDFRLLSTWGFTQEEVDEISELDGVQVAQGAVSFDVLYLDEQGKEGVLKANSMTEDVNKLTLAAGRLPERADECVLDDAYFQEDVIGQIIRIADDNSDETKESFAYGSYTVTGLVRSPLFLNTERGTTTVGSGRIGAFAFLLPQGFVYDYYGQVFVYKQGDLGAFTDAYDQQIEGQADSLEAGATRIIEERFYTEIENARTKIADAKQELADKVAQAQTELEDARQQLEDGEQQLAEGRQELEEAKATLAEKEQELADGEAALNEGVAQYNEGRAQYEDGRAQYEQGMQEYEAGRAQYEQGMREYEAGRAQYEQGMREYEAGRAQYESERASFNQQKAAYEAAASQGYRDPAIEAQLAQGELQLNAVAARLDQARAQLDATSAQLSQARAQLDATAAQLGQAKAQLDATGATLNQARVQLDASAAEIEGSRQLLESGRTELENGRTQIQDAEQEIEANAQGLADGWQEYNDGVAELEQQTRDAEAEIADAEEELNELEEPNVYVLDRNSNIGYASYESDIGIVESVSRVFPIFFVLIAALVCSTTMSRMVDDEHTQIGTLRSLGYGKGAIYAKYMIYAGSAAILGGITGFFIGIHLFPRTIWMAYRSLYGFADLALVTDYAMLAISLLVALVCSAGTAFLACRIELAHVPAELIRPKAPPMGRRILLERVPFIWKRMKFLYKVSARNIFRFKKRMFMMIIGIAGCMALVLAGLGLRDSISDVVNIQYDEIFTYDISVSFSGEMPVGTMEAIEREYGNEIEHMAALMQTGVDAPMERGSKSVVLFVDQGGELKNVISLHRNGAPVDPPGHGEILIDDRLSRVAGWNIGDEIVLKIGDAETRPMRVSGIFENYTMYYAYLSAGTYEEYFGEAYEQNTVFLALKEGADEFKIASGIGNMKNASNITVVSELRGRIGGMMESLNYVVILIIGSAGALAFVVLFNLGNINISERVREIATLKVLGFYPRETGSYVFRENAVLSAIGMALGIPLGIVFHRFIISQIHIDMISFQVVIKPMSYLFSLLIVLGFSVIVDLILRRKIDKIDMAESLKSIE